MLRTKAQLFPGADGPWTVLAHSGRDKSAVRFEKEILYEGTFIHPSTGRTHVFERADLERMAESSNQLDTEGISVPFPDGHRFDARSNLGFWSEFSVKDSLSKPGVSGLFGTVVVPLADDQKKIGKTITEVSAMVENEVKLTNGEQIEGPVCTHVCATNYPVVPGQENFIATLSSRASGEQEIEVESYAWPEKAKTIKKGEVKMDELRKLLAVSLGLDSGSSMEELSKAAKVFFARKTELEEENGKLLEDINVALGTKNTAHKT